MSIIGAMGMEGFGPVFFFKRIIEYLLNRVFASLIALIGGIDDLVSAGLGADLEDFFNVRIGGLPIRPELYFQIGVAGERFPQKNRKFVMSNRLPPDMNDPFLVQGQDAPPLEIIGHPALLGYRKINGGAFFKPGQGAQTHKKDQQKKDHVDHGGHGKILLGPLNFAPNNHVTKTLVSYQLVKLFELPILKETSIVRNLEVTYLDNSLLVCFYSIEVL